MSKNVSEISKESRLERAMRGDSIAGMMLIIVFVAMANGMLIGAGIIAIMFHADKVEDLRYDYDVNNIYINKLHSDLEAKGFKPPPLPTPRQEN